MIISNLWLSSLLVYRKKKMKASLNKSPHIRTDVVKRGRVEKDVPQREEKRGWDPEKEDKDNLRKRIVKRRKKKGSPENKAA